MKMIKKNFTVMKHKVAITFWPNANWWGCKISCPHNGGDHKVVCNSIDEVKSELYELANNNDCGRAISEKIHNWYFSEIKPNLD